ncbi:tripartite tricarboxylate transporter substrate binding protein [Acidovorax sp. SRB_24]|uniref:Bug family tripartite tricarboxylate transporter substrate binding protein n=1 Tax=Acidovorax sp. SRB_24 TaxID=1962700 RepID=UPI00145F0DD2|nr:tripartite tricarboxylate transporter substrate binding protein [Acidovorax sp. SRB_24]NMM77176.1 hypothetical protein [Acidovorax sp. SRB_24]
MNAIASRRKFGVVAITSALLLAFTHAAGAAQWPEKPITIIVPSSAGGSLDTNVRRMLEEAGKILGQPFVVENRAGAGGALAMQALARAKPDGYTLSLGNTASLAITPTLIRKAGYDPMKDFEFVGRFTSQPNLLVVRADQPYKTVAELTKYAKANPGKLSMGSQGNGSSGHLSGELYKKLASVEFVHVPYRGGVQAVQDLIGGSLDFLFENLATIENHVATGKVRALAVTSQKRNARFPDVPTMQELGISGYEITAWSGVIAPAGTPKPVIDRLNAAMGAALQVPAVKSQIVERGGVIEGGSPGAFKSFAWEEQVKWRTLIRSIDGLIDDANR